VGQGSHQTRMIFDPHTGALLANVSGDYVAMTIVAQGVVGSIDALPVGLAPIPGPRGLQPQVLAINPRVGGPRTVFKLELLSHASKAPRAGASALGALLAGPTGPRC
jgi:hypothetical protein